MVAHEGGGGKQSRKRRRSKMRKKNVEKVHIEDAQKG